MALVFQSAQMQQLHGAAERDFHRRALRYVQLRFPSVADSFVDEVLGLMVDNAIARAKSRRLTRESTVMRYVELMFAMAPNFDEHPQIRPRLQDASITPDERLDLIIEGTSYSAWREVTRRYDPAAWGVDPKLAPQILELRPEIRL